MTSIAGLRSSGISKATKSQSASFGESVRAPLRTLCICDCETPTRRASARSVTSPFAIRSLVSRSTVARNSARSQTHIMDDFQRDIEKTFEKQSLDWLVRNEEVRAK